MPIKVMGVQISHLHSLSSHRLVRLGHCPFKAVTRVQIPLGAIKVILDFIIIIDNLGKVVLEYQFGKEDYIDQYYIRTDIVNNIVNKLNYKFNQKKIFNPTRVSSKVLCGILNTYKYNGVLMEAYFSKYEEISYQRGIFY